MATYCCFWCPTSDFGEKFLDDHCPSCDRTYGFPLQNTPKRIQDYSVVRPLGRGFFGATFEAERGALATKSVLKVSPKGLYEFFGHKDFEKECRLHKEVASGTEHIVDIRDMFEADVGFGTEIVKCYVAELEYVDGRLLADYLGPDVGVTASEIAQIAIDLFRIREELRNKGVYHNDLHAENVIVERLGPNTRRSGVIHDSIRAVAIDLGSIADQSKSQSENGRLGDLHRIAEHLAALLGKLVMDPDEVTDADNRLASSLRSIVHRLVPSPEYQRTPEADDFIGQIEEAYYRAEQHWRAPLRLRAFGASYNAQTMHPWDVPRLLVDPDGQWLGMMSAPGPQVVTGMRGCGKTMLLRALQFHARGAAKEGETDVDILRRLKGDGFVGLFVSAQRLLDSVGGGDSLETDEAFGRLFASYVQEAVRALLHLADIDPKMVVASAASELRNAMNSCVTTTENLSGGTSLKGLDRLLSRMLAMPRDRLNGARLTSHPSTAFPNLAEAIARCSPMWGPAQVLFLLDDVSTRYLTESRIEELLSALIFQSPVCAFKLTSEAQTIELGLRSPGTHPARVGRDLDIFNLGAEVYSKIKSRGSGNGAEFVENILRQRAEYFVSHPSTRPRDLLGNVSLEKIASEIGTSRDNERGRKEVYRGITALARMCVGDIGDVISLYELILRKWDQKSTPIDAAHQSECFQDFCARRLYDLNRRDSSLKNFARSFAEASHKLLVESCREKDPAKRRVRQYASVYVRITTGDLDKQTERLRELVDAGVFVFAGGSNVPRTKTRDGNPMQQFKLTYRKIYGLVNFIGLGERDRFELSGADLEEWLCGEGDGMAVLLRNLESGGSDAGPEASLEGDDGGSKVSGEDGVATRRVPRKARDSEQTSLPIGFGKLLSDEMAADSSEGYEAIPSMGFGAVLPTIRGIPVSDVSDSGITSVVVGLGFEECSLRSVERWTEALSPREAFAIRYSEPGRSAEIEELLRHHIGKRLVVDDYLNVRVRGAKDVGLGPTMIDITGLSKPLIFDFVRNELRRSGRVLVCHTAAAAYYPLDDDLRGVMSAETETDRHALLDAVRDVLTGEEGPYTSERMLRGDSDSTRRRMLVAFSSAKHERLLSFLDDRDYDRIEIVTSNEEGAKEDVARVAAEVAAQTCSESQVVQMGLDDVDRLLAFLLERYQESYLRDGLNLEIALTGSKLQAMVCSALSAAVKISQCWYIGPRAFDPERFSKGVGETRYFDISLSPEAAQATKT